MSLPSTADVVVVRGFWWDEVTGQGVRAPGGSADATVKFEPVPLSGTTTPNLRDITSRGYIKTRVRTTTVDVASGYFAALLVASNDPDLDAYGGRKVTFQGEPPFVIAVPYNAPATTVDAAMAAKTGLTVGDPVRALWLSDATVIGNPLPTPPTSYLTATQTMSLFADLEARVAALEAG